MTLPPLPVHLPDHLFRGLTAPYERVERAALILKELRAYGLACRAAALEEAAKEAEHWQTISTTPGHACGQYIAAAIRTLQTAPAPTPSEPA